MKLGTKFIICAVAVIAVLETPITTLKNERDCLKYSLVDKIRPDLIDDLLNINDVTIPQEAPPDVIWSKCPHNADTIVT